MSEPRFAALLTAERLTLYPRAVLAALALAFVITVAGASGADVPAGRLGGDFPAFYAAGRIVNDGDIEDLYDWDRQIAAETDLFPPDDFEGFLPYVYPPFFALLYVPLALLPYAMAYVLHTIGLVGAVWGAMGAMRSRVPALDRWPLAAFAAALTFHPMLRAVGGAQNTPLTLLVLATTWHLASRRQDFLAGLVLGLGLFKPHYALPIIGLFLLERRLKLVAGAAASGLGLYAIGAAMAGPAWPAWWLRDGVNAFQARELHVQGSNAVSWRGFFEAILPGHPVAFGLGWGLAFATAGWMCWRFARGTDRDLDERMALAAVGTLLMAPHAVFYDAGLLVLPAAFLAGRGGLAAAPWLAGLWAASHLHPIAPWLGFDPLFLVAVAMLLSVAWQAPATTDTRTQAPAL